MNAIEMRVKTHGLRWTMAILGALIHKARTGHTGEWGVALCGPGRTYMMCPECGRAVRVTRMRG